MAQKRVFAIAVILILLFSGISFADDDGIDIAEEVIADVEHDEDVSFEKDLEGPQIMYEQKYGHKSMPNELFTPYQIASEGRMMHAEMYGSMDMHEDFLEMLKYCDDREKLKAFVLEKMEEHMGEQKDFCGHMEENADRCQQETTGNCNSMFQAYHDPGMPEEKRRHMEAYNRCPPDKEALIQSCIENSGPFVEDQKETMHERCDINWNQYGMRNYEDCNRNLQNIKCSKDEFTADCLRNWNVKPEDFKQSCLTSDEVSSRKAACKGTAEEQKENDCVKDVVCRVEDPEGKCSYSDYQQVCSGNGLTYTNSCSATLAGEGAYSYGTCASTRQAYSRTAIGANGQLLDSYEDFVEDCDRQWSNQERVCNDMQKNCLGKDDFISDCLHKEEGNIANMQRDLRFNCERDALVNIRNMQRECDRRNSEIQRCLKEGALNCDRMGEEVKRCKAEFDGEKSESMALEMAEKQCSLKPMSDKIENIRKAFESVEKFSAASMEVIVAVDESLPDDIKADIKKMFEEVQKEHAEEGFLIYKGIIKANDFGALKKSGNVLDAKILRVFKGEDEDDEDEKEKRIVDKVVERLLALQEQGKVSDDFSFFITEEASNIAEADDEAEEVKTKEEGRGMFYKMWRWMGFAKKTEKKEIEQLEKSAEKLSESIEKLEDVMGQANPVTKAVLEEQVQNLKAEKKNIEDLVQSKKEKARLLEESVQD